MTYYPSASSGQAHRCRSCGEPIRWERTPAGKHAPISLASGESHFVDCPQRRDWRKREPSVPARTRAERAPAADDGGAAPHTPTCCASSGQRPLFDESE
jgi:hypothetical protein